MTPTVVAVLHARLNREHAARQPARRAVLAHLQAVRDACRPGLVRLRVGGHLTGA